jgi:hypothetical protein
MSVKKEKVLQLVTELVEVMFEGGDPSGEENGDGDDDPDQSFTTETQPKTKEEMQLFNEHWEELDDDQKEEYLEGKIDSLGNEVEKKPKSSGGKGSKIDSKVIMANMKKYADKVNDREKCVKFLIKYGADKKKPKVNQIPEENFGKMNTAMLRVINKK